MEKNNIMRIIFTMQPDENGKITVINLIRYIIDNVPQINVPDTDISTISLASLTLAEDHNRHCIDGYASGKRWENGKFVEYEFTLIFR